MEIKGKVLTLFPVKEGVGKTSGTPWKSREFVIETQDQYPKRICLQVMNANILSTRDVLFSGLLSWE